MKRLVFIVEGDSEVIFIENVIIRHLYEMGFQNPMSAQTIITNRKQFKKGGVINYQYLKNDITNVLAQGNVIITTFIDFFKLPTNFPDYTDDSNKIHRIEDGIKNDFNNNPNVIPYIQRHEFESLLFSDISGFEFVIDDQDELSKIEEIREEYQNPEDINNSPETAPSKRLKKIFDYDKVSDAELMLEEIALETILEKCPRFANWFKQIVTILSNNN